MQSDRQPPASGQRTGAMCITNLLVSEDPVSAYSQTAAPTSTADVPANVYPNIEHVHAHIAVPQDTPTSSVTPVLVNLLSPDTTATTSAPLPLAAPQKRSRDGHAVVSKSQSLGIDSAEALVTQTSGSRPIEPLPESQPQAQAGLFSVFSGSSNSPTIGPQVSWASSDSTFSTTNVSHPAIPSIAGTAILPPASSSSSAATSAIAPASGPTPAASATGTTSTKRTTTRGSRQPIRSSIACLSCRRSKIKCDNQGPNGACETCIKAGKKCQYSEAGAPSRNPETAAPSKLERDGERDKKRVKRYGEIFHPDLTQYAELANEALSHEFLTAELWDEIFSYYKQHFSSELPFLHVGTLKAAIHRKLTTNERLPHETNLVLLGLLTLTARFHRDLGKYVSHFSVTSSRSKSSGTKAEIYSASSFYALVLVSALGPIPAALTVPGVERVQALLMLGVHEWMQGSNAKAASMYIGSAIRLALNMKMNRELDSPDMPIKYRQLPKPNPSPEEQRVASILAEVRRRTMYSCFILDRFINLGEDATWIMLVESLHLRLPCADEDVDRQTPNTLFWPSVSCLKNKASVCFDNPISFFVRLVDLWGEISKYSADGGRALDGPSPPWKKSLFKTLSDTLDRFVECLPPTYTCTMENYHQQRGHKTSLFISVHYLIALCQIMLHREYVPFVALRCTGPVGPLDPPLLTQAPEGFWIRSADILFRSSRDIADVVTWSSSALPFSPICLFGVWTSAFVGLYARHFPHMDMNCHMFDPQQLDVKGQVDITTNGATGIAFGALQRMAPFMAAGVVWQDTFEYCDGMFTEIARRFKDQQDHKRADAGGADMAPGTPLETPGRKDLWDSGYGGRITGNGVILTTQSPDTRHSTIQAGDAASPSDKDGPETPCDNASSASPGYPGDDVDYDDVEISGSSGQIRSMLEKLTFMELGQWMQQLSPDTNELITCVEKLHWGQAFPDQTICLDKPVEMPEAPAAGVGLDSGTGTGTGGQKI